MNNRFMAGPFVMIPSGAAKIMTVQEAHILQFVWSLCLEGARGYPTGQRKGQTWVQVSTQQIADALGFWSLRTIKKYVDDLIGSRLLLSASIKKTGRTNWLSPNYSEIERRLAGENGEVLGNPRTIDVEGYSAGSAPCIVQPSHHVLGNPRTMHSAAPAPCIVQDLHSPLYRSLDPLDQLDRVEGARENSEPEPATAPPAQKPLGDESPDSVKSAASEFEKIQAIADNVVWFDRLCAYYGQPLPPGSVAGIVAQVSGRIKDPKWLREYLLLRVTELAGNESNRNFASFIISDAAGWAPDESTRAERVSGRKSETNASGGNVEGRGRPELPHDVAFYDDGVIRPELEMLLAEGNDYYRSNDYLQRLYRKFPGQEQQIKDWMKARGLR